MQIMQIPFRSFCAKLPSDRQTTMITYPPWWKFIIHRIEIYYIFNYLLKDHFSGHVQQLVGCLCICVCWHNKLEALGQCIPSPRHVLLVSSRSVIRIATKI